MEFAILQSLHEKIHDPAMFTMTLLPLGIGSQDSFNKVRFGGAAFRRSLLCVSGDDKIAGNTQTT
jgi:hypothetical protein